MQIITKIFNETDIFFSNELDKTIYLNATKIAKMFLKDVNEWKRLPSSIAYIESVSRLGKIPERELIIVRKGGNDKNAQGTWIHKKLIIVFARWLSPDFAVWCDSIIEEILEAGSYSISQTPENPLKKRTENLEFAGRQFEVFEKTFFKIGITQKEELAITSNRAVKNETEIDFIKLAGKEGIETDTKFRTVTDLCKFIRGSDKFSDEIKLSVSTKKNDKPRPQNLNEILRDNGFQEKVDGDWKATEKGEKFSQFVQNKSKHSAKTVYHTVWKLEILKEIFQK